ncbi:unnamed protein product [Closterium sp. NIES-53]
MRQEARASMQQEARASMQQEARASMQQEAQGLTRSRSLAGLVSVLHSRTHAHPHSLTDTRTPAPNHTHYSEQEEPSTLAELEAHLPEQARLVLNDYRTNMNSQQHLQLLLSGHINKARAGELIEDTRIHKPRADNGHLVRLLSLQGTGAGDWLNAIPTRADLTLSPGQFSMVLGLRLGLALPVTEQCPCNRERSAISDKSLPNHLLRCGEGGDRTRTHNALVYACLRMANEAKYMTLHETTVYSPPRWNVEARRGPGWAAEEASIGKHKLYEVRPSYVGFLGLAVETYGALAADTERFFRLLATNAAKRSFRHGPRTTVAARLNAHYCQRWSVMLQRCQATSLLAKSNRAVEAASPQAPMDPWEPRLGDLWQVLEDGVIG